MPRSCELAFTRRDGGPLVEVRVRVERERTKAALHGGSEAFDRFQLRAVVGKVNRGGASVADRFARRIPVFMKCSSMKTRSFRSAFAGKAQNSSRRPRCPERRARGRRTPFL